MYAVYFKWLDDNFEDSFICKDRKELNETLQEYKKHNTTQVITNICRILKNGEYKQLKNWKQIK